MKRRVQKRVTFRDFFKNGRARNGTGEKHLIANAQGPREFLQSLPFRAVADQPVLAGGISAMEFRKRSQTEFEPFPVKESPKAHQSEGNFARRSAIRLSCSNSSGRRAA